MIDVDVILSLLQKLKKNIESLKKLENNNFIF